MNYWINNSNVQTCKIRSKPVEARRGPVPKNPAAPEFKMECNNTYDLWHNNKATKSEVETCNNDNNTHNLWESPLHNCHLVIISLQTKDDDEQEEPRRHHSPAPQGLTLHLWQRPYLELRLSRAMQTRIPCQTRHNSKTWSKTFLFSTYLGPGFWVNLWARLTKNMQHSSTATTHRETHNVYDRTTQYCQCSCLIGCGCKLVDPHIQDICEVSCHGALWSIISSAVTSLRTCVKTMWKHEW